VGKESDIAQGALNAVMPLLGNGEETFLKKLVNILVLLLTLWSRFQLFACTVAQTKRWLISCFLCGNLQNNFSPYKAPRHTKHT
jgi:hypothetical protein